MGPQSLPQNRKVHVDRAGQIKQPFLTMKSRPFLFLVLLLAVALPQRALANVGTPLMWAAFMHLVIGNALIGLGEGALLAWLFSTPKGKSILVMIVANYGSAWIGGVFFQGAILNALPINLNNAWMWFWVMVVLAYFMTLVLEWPFIAWCFRGARDWRRKSLRATLVLQTVSYVLLFGWYWIASDASLYTKMNIVEPSGQSLPESVLVYYINPADGDVYRRQLTAGEERKAFELGSTHPYDRLFVRPNTTDTSRWDLVARIETGDYRNPRFVDVLTTMPLVAAPDGRSTDTHPPVHEDTWMNFGKARPLGSATNSQWEFVSGFWPMLGVEATNRVTGERVRFSYETPFGTWIVRNAVHLPTDKVLFQLGDDQICAFDPVSRRVALLWRGRGPVPVIESDNVESSDAAHAGNPAR